MTRTAQATPHLRSTRAELKSKEFDTSNRSSTSVEWKFLPSVLIGFLCTNVVYGLPVVLSATLSNPANTILSLTVTSSITFILLIADIRHFIVFWLHLVLLQNAATGLWFADLAGDVPLAITEAKTVSIVLAVVLLLPRIAALLVPDRWLIGGIAMYSVGLLTNLSSVSPVAIANLRNFIIPLCILFVALYASSILHQRVTVSFTIQVSTIATVWLAVGALLEYVTGTSGWRKVFNADSIGGLNSLSETTTLLGIELPRIGGFLLEPVNAGYAAASVLVIYAVLASGPAKIRHGVQGFIVCSLALYALISAATKNGLLMFAMVVFATIVSKRFGAKAVILSSWAVAFMMTLGYATLAKGPAYLSAVFRDPVGASGGESTSIHMAGLLSGLFSLASSPGGHGLGSGGNFLKLFDPTISRQIWLSTGSESGWGTLAYQGGILCVVGLALVVLRFSARFGRSTLILLVVWSSAALFAESFFGPIASSLLMLSAGLLAIKSPRSRSTPHVIRFRKVGTSRIDSPALRRRYVKNWSG
jgi:hypothetical protein